MDDGLALAAVGLGNTLIDISGYTLLQRAAPEEVLGRVFGVLESFLLTSIAIGAVLAPVLIGAASGCGARSLATGLSCRCSSGLGWGALRQLDSARRRASARWRTWICSAGVPMLAALGGPGLERPEPVRCARCI